MGPKHKLKGVVVEGISGLIRVSGQGFGVYRV